MKQKLAMRIIPYGRQQIDQQDIEEVIKVLKTPWISQGPKINEFEEALAAYCGAKYAVVVSSGTAALHLACLAAGLSKGDEAITTPVTFLATANSVLYTGATPVFADIQYDTVNIDPVEIEKMITKKTKVILPVHFAGLPADLKEISKIARQRNLSVIEDACHALGAEYHGKRVGSCRYSEMTVFSFHPVKHITTGEGGCITTNDKKHYEKLKMLRHHGIYRNDTLRKHYGNWFHEMRDLGFNYRITDFQCALGLSQLRKLDRFLARRHEIAASYDAAFTEFSDDFLLPKICCKDRAHSWHLYLLRLKNHLNGMARRRMFDKLVANGISPQVHYIPLYRQPFYREIVRKANSNFPNSERYYQEVISLPMYPSLSDKEVESVIKKVKAAIFELKGQVVSR